MAIAGRLSRWTPTLPPPPIANEEAIRRASLQSLLIFLDNHEAACPQCGYSLRGIGSDHCPECGWAITLRPSDGIDRRRVLLLTSWIAVIGLVISLAQLVSVATSMLSFFRSGSGSMWLTWLVFQLGYVVLLVLSASALLRVRGMRAMPTAKFLRQSKRFSLAILIATVVVFGVPAVFGLLVGLYQWLAWD